MNKLFALAVMLYRHEGNTVTTRQMVGYAYAPSKEAAVGDFVISKQEKHPGFTLGEVVTIEVPPALDPTPRYEMLPLTAKIQIEDEDTGDFVKWHPQRDCDVGMTVNDQMKKYPYIKAIRRPIKK